MKRAVSLLLMPALARRGHVRAAGDGMPIRRALLGVVRFMATVALAIELEMCSALGVSSRL